MSLWREESPEMAAAETILDLLQLWLKKFIRVREAAATLR